VRRFLLGAGLLALGACATSGQDDPAANACDSTKASGLVGRAADTALIEEARRLAGAKTARVITPGMIVTMEFRADRLTLNVDDNGAVAKVVCG
jgi:hypothetical protein